MHIPVARERVRIKDREEVYFVLAVDTEASDAYVIDLGGSREVETVRFEDISPTRENQ